MKFKKENEDSAVQLFEQLIFSNILSNEKNVPSTMDGLEPLIKLISQIKK